MKKGSEVNVFHQYTYNVRVKVCVSTQTAALRLNYWSSFRRTSQSCTSFSRECEQRERNAEITSYHAHVSIGI